jgi:adenosylhomocysteinase
MYLRKPVTQSPAGPEEVELRPIGKGTAHEAMRGLLWLVRAAGYAGLVLCIDEVEELAKLPSRKRQDHALQALREYVDHAGGDGGYRHLCLYLAATPEMFEGERYFPRYDALATRIMPLGPDINWRAPVIDLDRTPLTQPQMREMATRIQQVHRAAYGAPTARFTDDLMNEILSGIVESRFRIAKPRLLARIVIDELERARQGGSGYTPPGDVTSLIAQAAKRIAQEASA